MIRKLLFAALFIVPLMLSAQKTVIIPGNTRIVISGNSYSHYHNPVSGLVRYITSPLRFVESIFCKQKNFAERIFGSVTYRLPFMNDERIILNKHIITLPHQRFLIEQKGNNIIIEKNGRTIYIRRNRRI